MSVAWENNMSYHGSATAWNGESLILCIPNVSNKSYYDTEENQLSA